MSDLLNVSTVHSYEQISQNWKKWRRMKLIKPVRVCREKRDVRMNQLEFLILISGSGKGRSLKLICFINSQYCSWFMWHFWDSVCFSTASELWSAVHLSGGVCFVSVVVVFGLWQSAQMLPFTQTKEVFWIQHHFIYPLVAIWKKSTGVAHIQGQVIA